MGIVSYKQDNISKKLTTCGCGASMIIAPRWVSVYQNGGNTQTFAPEQYCHRCGDRLNEDGTVESRAELEEAAAKWRAAQNKEATVGTD